MVTGLLALRPVAVIHMAATVLAGTYVVIELVVVVPRVTVVDAVMLKVAVATSP